MARREKDGIKELMRQMGRGKKKDVQMGRGKKF